MDIITLTTLDRARCFAERHRITARPDWDESGMLPWRVYEQFKRELAEEVSPGCDGWRPAVRALAEALHL